MEEQVKFNFSLAPVGAIVHGGLLASDDPHLRRPKIVAQSSTSGVSLSLKVAGKESSLTHVTSFANMTALQKETASQFLSFRIVARSTNSNLAQQGTLPPHATRVSRVVLIVSLLSLTSTITKTL
ncbi:unnamed protein product [Spodoptera exigua]|nr:unnamed protein product [Spodoptera exigua]